MPRILSRIANAVESFTATAIWSFLLLPFNLISKIFEIIAGLNTALCRYVVILIQYLAITFQLVWSSGKSVLNHHPVGQIYRKIKILMISPVAIARHVVGSIFGLLASPQRQDALLILEQRGLNHDQRIQTLETHVVRIRSCQCQNVSTIKGNAREVKSEDEALEGVVRIEGEPGPSEPRPVGHLRDRSLYILDQIPPAEAGQRRDTEDAASTEGFESQERPQPIVLPRPNPVVIETFPQRERPRRHGSLIQQNSELEREQAEEALGENDAHRTDEPRKQQASPITAQAHHTEQSHPPGLARPPGAVKDQVPGQAGQPSSEESSRTAEARFNLLQTRSEGLEYPAGRAYRSVYQRDF